MKSPSKQKPYVLAVGTLLILYAANFMFVQWGGEPFLYCIGRHLVAPFYEMVKAIFGLLALGYFIYVFAMHKYNHILSAFIFVILAYGMPQFADTIFRLGGSCG